MIKLTSPLTQVDSTPKFTVGTKTQTKDGKEYIYLEGVADVVANDWVSFTSSTGSVARLLTTDTIGNVAVAVSAVVTGRYGWFGIKGQFTAKFGRGTLTAGQHLYSSGTVAYAGSEVIAGDLIAGAYMASGASSTAATGTVLAELNYPFATGTIS